MEASIARGFIRSQNKAAYIYILIDKRVNYNLFYIKLHYLFFTCEIRFIRAIRILFNEYFAFQAGKMKD